MSFFCRYITGRDYCSRRDLECRPGAEGCVLRGRVVFADDSADAPAAAEPLARKPRHGRSRQADDPTRQADDPSGASAPGQRPPGEDSG